MKRTHFAALIVVVTMCAGCSALFEPVGSPPEPPTFEQADTNNDGIVSDAESEASRTAYESRVKRWRETVDLKVRPEVEMIVQTAGAVGSAFVGPVSGTVATGIMAALALALRKRNEIIKLDEKTGRTLTDNISDAIVKLEQADKAAADEFKTRIKNEQESVGVRGRVQELRGKA